MTSSSRSDLGPVPPTWRVTDWELSDDGRWKVAAVSDHPNGDWQNALAVARTWFAMAVTEIEAHKRRIKVDPVDPK